jgi:hypothetical protein
VCGGRGKAKDFLENNVGWAIMKVSVGDYLLPTISFGGKIPFDLNIRR